MVSSLRIERLPGSGARRLRVSLSPSNLEPAEAEGRLAELIRFALGCPELARPRLTHPQLARPELARPELARPRLTADSPAAAPREFAVEYELGGDSLAELRAAGRLDPPALVALLRGVARALGHLHDQGIGHGEVREELLHTGTPALGGLGLAALLGVASPSPARDWVALGGILAELARGWATAPESSPNARAARELERWVASVGDGRGVAPSSLEALAEALAAPEAQGNAAPALRDAAAPAAPLVEPAPPLGEPAPPLLDPAPPESPPPTQAGAEGSFAGPVVAAPAPGVRWAGASARRAPELPQAAVDPPKGRPHAALWLAGLLGAGLMVSAVIGAFVVARGRPRISVSASASFAVSTPGASAAPSATMPAPPPSEAPTATPPPPGRPSEAAAGLALGGALPPSRAPLPREHLRAPIPIDEDCPTLGEPRALVTIVVFGDPASAPVVTALGRLERAAAALGSARLVWRYAPEDTMGARTARVAAGISSDLGVEAFWTFLDGVGRVGGIDAEATLVEAAARVGAEKAQVERWLTRPEGQAAVERDRALAVLFGVRRVPSLFVNGRRLAGDAAPARLVELLRDEHRKAASRVADGIAPAALYPDRVAYNWMRVGEEPALVRCPAVTGAPSRGAAHPLVTLVEVTDFECELCAKLAPAIDRLVLQARDLRHVHLDYPLEQHPNAKAAALFARTARAHAGEDAFFRLRGALFARAAPLVESELVAAARAAGLDAEALLAAARRGERTPELEAARTAAKRAGVRGVPTLFVNGRRLDGVRNPAELTQAIETERARAARLVAAGIPESRVYEVICGL